MKTFLSTLGLVAFTLAGASAVSAQSSPAPTPATSAAPSPSPSPSAPPKTLQFSGFADAGYVSGTGNATLKFTNGSNSRVFDTFNREPDLQNLDIQATLTAGSLGGKLELNGGTDPDVFAAYPAAGNGFDVQQAYLTYTLGKLTLQGGKFVTLAGAEVIDSPGDSNYSRSILFGFAIPFTHTGGRLTYALTNQLSVIAGINAGWDDIRETNGQRTVEYGAAWNPSSVVSFAAQGYTGYEQLNNYSGCPTTGVLPSCQQGQRTLIDAVGTYHATSALSFTANYDRGRQGNASLFDTTASNTANWSGLAGYATYAFNPKVSGTLRYEGFHDTDGYRTGFAQYWREGTLTVGYSPTSAVTFRGEFRHDTSDHAVFLNAGNVSASTLSSFGLEALVKF